jgi:hypothetical protein
MQLAVIYSRERYNMIGNECIRVEVRMNVIIHSGWYKSKNESCKLNIYLFLMSYDYNISNSLHFFVLFSLPSFHIFCYLLFWVKVDSYTLTHRRNEIYISNNCMLRPLLFLLRRIKVFIKKRSVNLFSDWSYLFYF